LLRGFIRTKKFNVSHNFVVAAVNTLQLLGRGGGKAGSSYELDAAQTKFFSILWTFQAASYSRHKSLPNSSFC